MKPNNNVPEKEFLLKQNKLRKPLEKRLADKNKIYLIVRLEECPEDARLLFDDTSNSNLSGKEVSEETTCENTIDKSSSPQYNSKEWLADARLNILVILYQLGTFFQYFHKDQNQSYGPFYSKIGDKDSPLKLIIEKTKWKIWMQSNLLQRDRSREIMDDILEFCMLVNRFMFKIILEKEPNEQLEWPINDCKELLQLPPGDPRYNNQLALYAHHRLKPFLNICEKLSVINSNTIETTARKIFDEIVKQLKDPLHIGSGDHDEKRDESPA